jgi:hypothetical protein
MNVQINLPSGLPSKSIKNFIDKLRFNQITFLEHYLTQMETECPEGIFCIDVFDGQSDFKVQTLTEVVNSIGGGLLVFNQDALVADEPKVVFATDHSLAANKKLSLFKTLKPAGFGGASVVSFSDPIGSQHLSTEVSKEFLDKTKNTVLATQANLIIVNFDFENQVRRSWQFSNLAKLILQNKCHVLILKNLFSTSIGLGSGQKSGPLSSKTR